MHADRWEQIKSILDAALDLDPAERERLLDARCAEDPEARREVEALLRAHAELGKVDAFYGVEDVPERIGPYHVLRTLARGGMGVVYLAEQAEPIRRQVALKLIKVGMDTREVVSRFAVERQALALMSHPHIANVLDAGSTETGRPYFVMEYVPGIPITEYCDSHRLDLRERLELFLRVCDAIQHAHQKGVVHRDIKPSNVLVMRGEHGAIPKVIDFGIAKATSLDLLRHTLHTRDGAIMGTPEYMSPEQASPSIEGVDTRTDVYSLGVLLYELLTGYLPFGRSSDPETPPDEILRRIRLEDPTRPSARLAMARRSDTKSVVRMLRRDLDWIVLRALDKVPERRYASASELAADVRRHLADEAVEARPPSVGYRTRKFARRHRAGVAAAGIALFAVTVGVALALTGLARAREAEASAARQARAKERVSQFLQDLFKVSDPNEARGRQVTARELLDRATANIDGELSEDPEIAMELLGTMGNVYLNLGLYSEAQAPLERALELRRKLRGEEHPETLAATHALVSLLWGQGRFAEARPLAEQNLERFRRVRGAEHADTLKALLSLANVQADQGEFDAPERLYREALEIQSRTLGDDHPNTLHSANNLAVLYKDAGRDAEAETLFREVYETRRRVQGADHPETLRSMTNLANVLREQARHAEAEPLYQEALAISLRVLGPDHPRTTGTKNSLANLYKNQGRLADAERLYLEAIEAQKRTLGAEHPETLITLYNLGDVLKLQRRYAEAETTLVGVVEARRRVHGPEHQRTLNAIFDLGRLYRELGRDTEAEPLLEEAAGGRARALGAEHPSTLEAERALAELRGARSPQ